MEFWKRFGMVSRCLAATASLAALTAPAFAAEEELHSCQHGKLERFELYEAAAAYDEATGRDLRNFPPDRIADYTHMKLAMRFEDLASRSFTATETLAFTPISETVDALTLNAVGLKASSVTMGGKSIEHAADDETITLRFEPPLMRGESVEIAFEYECSQPWAGMIFTPPSSEVPNYLPQIHTQGQTETNRHWFICHDSPNERLTTELVVDVPAGLQVSGNGRLVSHEKNGSREVWHYLQDKPHVNYLVSMVIGTFDIVKLEPPGARVPMQVWVPPGQADRVVQTFGRTGEMMDLFEQRFGIAYPWDRYDQIVVKNFGAGGMENTSATTLHPTAALDEIAIADRDLESLIAHELAHQWTGDMITCKGWQHIWLNEGWATYGSALWFEKRDGIDGYLDSMRSNFRVARRDRTSGTHAMTSNVYEQPWETFRRAANPYPKGASILHMLRMMLGEETFWRGVHLYLNRHALGVVETNDFRYAMEEASGLGLQWFFDQWCDRPGTPELDVNIRYDGATRELLVDIEQKQKFDDRTPAFRFELPIVARTKSGDHEFAIDVRERSKSWRTTLDGPPEFVSVDPELHVLKTIEVTKPQAWWTAEVTSGPTIAARHEAIDALAKYDSPETIALLGSLIRDRSVRYTLRNSAVDSLASLGSAEAKAELLAIAKAGMDHPRVRVIVTEQLRKLDKDVALPALAEIAGSDPSYKTRVEAIEALAHFEAKDYSDLIVELVEFPSQHDDVRNAALNALAELDDARGLELGIKFAAYGYMDRSRPEAIETLGKLAKHDPDRSVPLLLSLLDDPESRSVRAAASALVDAADKRAIPALQAMSESHPNPRMREHAERNLEALMKKLDELEPNQTRSRGVAEDSEED